jgi:transcriptional regulator with GAF, ATPase, and Fis domain
MNGLQSSGHCWKAIMQKDGKPFCSKQLNDYFATKINLPDFPFVIFSDHIPDNEVLSAILHSEKLVAPKRKLIILALKNRSNKENFDYWQLLETGVDDVIEWTEEDEIISYLESKYLRGNLIKETLESPLVRENLAGISPVWRKFLSEIIEATLFSQASILLIGESGTGKELISRLIHTIDKRPGKTKLTIVDCTTIVPELSGSELFGHERGSYTSAIQSREGAFALANGGTLFLDEVGELPVTLQAELLRVLQEGTYKKVGSNTWQQTKFRLICATNKNLQQAMEKGEFRQDLYFRIADCEFFVPSLQERREDIPVLVNHFLAHFFPSGECPQVDRPVMEYLMKRNYPGNVRELKQLVQRILIKHVKHNKITIGELPANEKFHQTTNSFSFVDRMEDLIRAALLAGEDWWNLKDTISETAIQVALELENNNKEKAAERLKVNVRTVQQYVKKKYV